MDRILYFCVVFVIGLAIYNRADTLLQNNKSIEVRQDFRIFNESKQINELQLFDNDTVRSKRLLNFLRAAQRQEIIPQAVLNEKCVESDEFSWTEYYGLDSVYTFLKKTCKDNEGVQVMKAGRTYEGRDILGLRINTQSKTEGRKQAVFIESGIHPNEWITTATITYFIKQLLTSKDANITALRDAFDWHIIPVANPDGYQYSCTVDRFWRQTRSKLQNGCIGVDLNRNWDYHWSVAGGSDDPCNKYNYVGPAPFSEIESRTLSEYIAGVENLLGYLAFHADAQLLLVPYSDSADHSLVDNYDDLVKIGKTSLEYGHKVNGAVYDIPNSCALLLYPVSGASDDWVLAELNTRLVYTYELRGDSNRSWPKERISEQGGEVTQMLLGFAHEAKRLGYY